MSDALWAHSRQSLPPHTPAPPRTAPAVASAPTPTPTGVWIALGVVTLLAAALRCWHLGAWSFDSDETFTLRDSLQPQLSNPRPLFYFLNYYLVRPFHPLDELGLRLLPALFGVLAIPTFFLVARRLVGPRAALAGTLLLAGNPLQVYYAQFARYWTLVFLLATIYPFALYRGLREHNRAALALGLLTGATAALAHPTAVLLVGGLGLWAALTYRPGPTLAQLWRQPAVRWGTALAALGTAGVLARFLPLLHQWIVQHDGGPNTEFLLHIPGRPGIKQLVYLVSYAESLTVPLTILGLLGITLLWQGRDRALGQLLTGLVAVPLLFLTLLSLRTPVSTFYLVPTLPAMFLGAGVLLDYLAELPGALRPRWLFAAAVTTLVLAVGAPTLLSQYRDGRRYDYRGVAQWLAPRLAPGDRLVSDQPKALQHYLPTVAVEYLRGDPAPLQAHLQAVQAATPPAALWIVTPAPAHAFRTNPAITRLRAWLYAHCQLRQTLGVGRMDFRQYYLQIFRCPARPAPPDTTTAP